MTFRFLFIVCALLWGYTPQLLGQQKKVPFPADLSIEEAFGERYSKEMIGTPAPKFTAQTMDGQVFGAEELLGKVIVLNFWFIACPPCKIEKPVWNEVVQAYADDDRVVFLSICKDKDRAAINAYLQKQQIDMPIVADGTSLIEQFKVGSFPTTLIIDRRGRYSAGVMGVINKNTMQKLINHALLGKKPNPKHLIDPIPNFLPNEGSSNTPHPFPGNQSSTFNGAGGALGQGGAKPPIPPSILEAMEGNDENVQVFDMTNTKIKDEDGNTLSFFELITLTESEEYIQEDKTDADGKTYILLRKASAAERVQIQEDNKRAYSNSNPQMEKLNRALDQELIKNYPPVTPDTPIRIKDGPKISYADYQKKMASGAWYEKGILSSTGSLASVELIEHPDKGELSELNKELYNDLKSVIGKPVEPFELTDLDGNVIRSQDTQGKVLVFNFWFTSCKPCIAEFPALNTVYQRYKNDPRVVFAAITFERRDKVKAFVDRGKYPLDYPIVAQNHRFLKQFKNPGSPSNVVVGTDNKILYNAIGTNKLLVVEQLTNAIENALAQKDPQTHGQVSVYSHLWNQQKNNHFKKIR